MSSVLEEQASSTSESSPEVVEVSRRRARNSRPQAPRAVDIEELSSGGDTAPLEDEDKEPSERAYGQDERDEEHARPRRGRREQREDEDEDEDEPASPLRRRAARSSQRHEEEEEEEAQLMLTPSPVASSSGRGGAGGDSSSAASPASKRYSLRQRRSKPDRFDESMYNDVFHSAPSPDDFGSAAPDSEPRGSKKRKRIRRRGRARKKPRRRFEDDEDDGGQGGESGEPSLDEINAQIQLQERQERQKAEADAKAEARRARSTRYSLRSQEAHSSMGVATNGSLLAAGSSSLPAKTSSLELAVPSGHDGDADNESQSENEAPSEDDARRGPASSTRYSLRRRSQRLHQHAMASRRAGDASPTTTRSRTRDEASPLFAEGNGGATARYALRDRTKMQRVEADEDALASTEATSAYAEYHKRQASGRAAGGGSRKSRASAGGSNRRRLFLSSVEGASPPSRRRRERERGRSHHGRRHHRRRSLSSSSSSSGGGLDSDDSDGGMLTSSPWRGGAKRKGSGGGSARADITPVEVDRSVTWASVGGLTKHIEALKEMVMLPLLYPEFYDKYGVSPPSGVLFYGPPGTGKTLLARALANSCSVFGDGDAPGASSDATQRPPRRAVTFYMRKGADCLSKWVGEAERQLRLLFEEAKRNEPAIIFFDEMDGLAPVRSAKQDQIHASIVSTLLALMDGMDSRGRVVVIGATNRLDAIDPALRRPGRFDRELGFTLPNVAERKSMLGIHSSHWQPPLAARFLGELAELTVGYCGADIKALCAEAALCSLRRVYPQVYASQDKLLIDLDKVVVARGDFARAMKKITPASHRAVSSFASPLPRAVRGLLHDALVHVLGSVAERFPLFPLDVPATDEAAPASASARAKHVDVADAGDQEDEDDVDIYAVVSHEDCDVCHGEQGQLLRCAACPAAFHGDCLASASTTSASEAEGAGDATHSGLWFCSECLAANVAAVETARRRARKKRVHSIASLQLPRYAGFPRVLLAGEAAMGQQYLGPALLHALEGLTHVSLDYPSLVADVNAHHPEEALIKRLGEAQRCLPCVLYLPQVELWWQNTSESMHVALRMMLTELQSRANLPILFLACTSGESRGLRSLPKDLLALFHEDATGQRTAITKTLASPRKEARLAHFTPVFESLATPPPRRKPKTRRTQDEKLEVLPLAPLPAKKPQRAPSPEERDQDLHELRELRIFLSQVLDYCSSTKQYTPFHLPVDPAAVPNYYLIVQRPMDLSTMREKLNDEEYTCFEQFMDDLQLIVRNANVFNPKRSATRHIAHAAGIMKDNVESYAHRFRDKQGYDLFAKCREATRRLRAFPDMYGKYGRRFLRPDAKSNVAATVASSKSSPSKPEGAVRVSARLRGLKAPAIEEIAPSLAGSASPRTPGASRDHAKPQSDSDDAAVEEKWQTPEEPENDSDKSDKSDKSMEARDVPRSLKVQEWFAEDEEEEEEESSPASSSTVKNRSTSADDAGDDETGAASDAEQEDEDEGFEVGGRVFVRSRTFPGMNRQGGAGVVLDCNDDGTYNVKYILGGSEKNVGSKYITRLTDDAIMSSVKTRRSEAVQSSALANGANPAASVRLIQHEDKMDETDYFDELLWPMLKEEGWRREDQFAIIEASDKEAGLAVQHVVFYPGTLHDGEPVVLHGVMEAMAYLNAAPELATKCFGSRYSEEMQADKVLGVAKCEEEGQTAKPMEVDLTEDKTPVPTQETESKSDEAMQDAEEAAEDTPEFIYDEARMSQVLQTLVAKTAGWTVDALRDELLLLHKLSYPFRNRFDRRELMAEVDAHVNRLQ